MFGLCLARTHAQAGYLKLFGSKEVQDALMCTRNKLDEMIKAAKKENE
mgnify:CR=1 FL=1